MGEGAGGEGGPMWVRARWVWEITCARPKKSPKVRHGAVGRPGIEPGSRSLKGSCVTFTPAARGQHRSWSAAPSPPWSSGLGRLPFTQEIAGSNPAGGTWVSRTNWSQIRITAAGSPAEKNWTRLVLQKKSDRSGRAQLAVVVARLEAMRRSIRLSRHPLISHSISRLTPTANEGANRCVTWRSLRPTDSGLGFVRIR